VRVFHPIGHRGWYGDFATKLCLRREDKDKIVKQAIADGFTTKSLPIAVLSDVFGSKEGYERYIHEPMNRTHLPDFFFVERMISKERKP
jgi:hypothetical protein